MGRLTEQYLGIYELSKVGVTDCWKICEGTNDCHKCVIQEAFNKLGRYEDLEEAGRLIELPCAVGETVWVVDLGVDKKITKQIDGETWHRVVRERNITERCFVISDYGQLGRYVFLTKEEAERKLKELEE